MERTEYRETRFRFGTDSAGQPIVYRPNEILVRADQANLNEALAVLTRLEPDVEQAKDETPTFVRRVNDKWGVLAVPPRLDPRAAVSALAEIGIDAQLNHVYFAGTLSASPNYAAPNYAAPNYAAPNYAAPNYAAPNYAAPNYAAPNYAAPNYAAPNYAAPNYAAGSPGACRCDDCAPLQGGQPTVPQNSAVPVRRGPGCGLTPIERADLQIHVLDVRPQVDGQSARDEAETRTWIDGLASLAAPDRAKELIHNPGALLPEALFLADELNAPTAYLSRATNDYVVEPASPGLGANVDADNFLDPVTNHTIFIKDIIDRTLRPSDDADASYVTVHSVMGSLGAVDDAALARAIEHVAHEHPVIDDYSIRIMNLSLSGYIDGDTAVDVLAETIERVQELGWLIVASAGNNGSCRPSRPASLPEVVSVGAYGPDGPAWFSNYGPWVDACASGVNIVSKFPGPEDQTLTVRGELQTDIFTTGWASWSGTSFAAPYVAAIIARWIADRAASSDRETAYADALAALITEPTALRIHNYGTVVSDQIIRIASTIEEI